MKYFLDEPPPSFRPSREPVHGDPLLFAFEQSGNLVLRGGAPPLLSEATSLPITSSRSLGVLGDRSCVAAALEDKASLPEGFESKSLRRLIGALDADVLSVAAIASQIAHFLSTHRRCGTCGGPMQGNDRDHALRCEACERDVYPAVAPCVIVLVHDEDRILLTRQPRFPQGMYGLVAGFVEPGESLENCARREILEEVGLSISDLRYVASQPWPFPSQLMVGMTARYQSGEIALDDQELEEAKWFHLDALPMIPPPFSIARHIIELYRAARGRS